MKKSQASLLSSVLFGAMAISNQVSAFNGGDDYYEDDADFNQVAEASQTGWGWNLNKQTPNADDSNASTSTTTGCEEDDTQSSCAELTQTDFTVAGADAKDAQAMPLLDRAQRAWEKAYTEQSMANTLVMNQVSEQADMASLERFIKQADLTSPLNIQVKSS